VRPEDVDVESGLDERQTGAFYERWGFSTRVGRSLLMRRTDDPLLT
jgi:hypothetical protein